LFNDVSDLLIYSGTGEEHLLHNRSFFFTTLQLLAVKFNPTKETLGRKKIDFMGHVAAASSIGTFVGPTGQSFSQAELLAHVQHVMGIVGFCCRIIPSFSRIVVHLNRMKQECASSGQVRNEFWHHIKNQGS